MSLSTRPVTLLSGGTGGIGRAIALDLAAQGHQLQLISKTSDGSAFAASLPGSGHQAYLCDVADAARVHALVGDIKDRLGRIDVCIHAAVSPLIRKKLSVMTPAEFREPFETIVFGAFYLFQSVAAVMRIQRQGRIIGITSAAIEPNAPSGTMPGYISAKYALRGLLRELARELAPYGVSVCAVAPDFVPTSLHRDLPERALELLREHAPGGKLLSPEEVAHVVTFLCSEAAPSLTGFSFPVSTGEVMNL